MNYDPTIRLGDVMTMISILGTAIALIVGIRVELRNLKETVRALAGRLDKHEGIVFGMSKDLQRVIGRLEVGPPHAQRPN